MKKSIGIAGVILTTSLVGCGGNGDTPQNDQQGNQVNNQQQQDQEYNQNNNQMNNQQNQMDNQMNNQQGYNNQQNNYNQQNQMNDSNYNNQQQQDQMNNQQNYNNQQQNNQQNYNNQQQNNQQGLSGNNSQGFNNSNNSNNYNSSDLGNNLSNNSNNSIDNEYQSSPQSFTVGNNPRLSELVKNYNNIDNLTEDDCKEILSEIKNILGKYTTEETLEFFNKSMNNGETLTNSQAETMSKYMRQLGLGMPIYNAKVSLKEIFKIFITRLYLLSSTEGGLGKQIQDHSSEEDKSVWAAVANSLEETLVEQDLKNKISQIPSINISKYDKAYNDLVQNIKSRNYKYGVERFLNNLFELF